MTISQALATMIGSINRVDVWILFVIIFILYLAKIGRLPSVESMRRFTAMLDDRGGNILVLALFTVWFVSVTIKMFYSALGMIGNNYIRADNAILLMALNTISSGFAGTCFGALIKTMSGAMTVAPPNASTGGGVHIPEAPILASPSGVTNLHVDGHITGMGEEHHV